MNYRQSFIGHELINLDTCVSVLFSKNVSDCFCSPVVRRSAWIFLVSKSKLNGKADTISVILFLYQ